MWVISREKDEAVVIGGGSLSGGEGSAIGSIVGALIMAVLRNGCNMLGVPNYVQEIIIGDIIVCAVLIGTPFLVSAQEEPVHLNPVIAKLEAGGSTALFAGVSKGAQELRKFLDLNRVNTLILLSDGLANVGPSSPGELAQLGVVPAVAHEPVLRGLAERQTELDLWRGDGAGRSGRSPRRGRWRWWCRRRRCRWSSWRPR